MGVFIIGFIKAHARAVSNLLVALLVLAAVASKAGGEEMDHLFRREDLYLLGGAFLALLLLRLTGKGMRKK